MGRIRLRVRDIDYPEPKIEPAHPENRSQKSGSPRSQSFARSRPGNKTNLSSIKRHSDSIIDEGDSRA
jgi:hypothetical protein